MAFGDAALAAILGGPFGVTLTFDGEDVSVLFAETDSSHDFGGMSPGYEVLENAGLDATERRTWVIAPATAFASGGALESLAVDSTVTVDGRTFGVREFGPTDDGRLYRVRLAEG